VASKNLAGCAMSKTSIEWTERTWNPVRGCTRISPGCVNCYAERQSARGLPGHKSPTTGEPFAIMTSSGPRWTGKVGLIPHMLEIPLKRRNPTIWFVNSMSDLFHEDLADEEIDQVFAVMVRCPRHTFQVLTKRADRMLHVMTKVIRTQKFWPMPNVWLGVSVEDQQRANERIPLLLQTPAAVRFLSVEPLLGPVDLMNLCAPNPKYQKLLQQLNALTGWRVSPDAVSIPKELRGVDWVIVGGESGPGARPMHPDWALSIRDQCSAAGVPFFFKQWGEYAPVTVDDRHGAIVPIERREAWVLPDGRTTTREAIEDFAWPMQRVGKKAAGSLLDGREWKQMPEVQRHA
jgi:protein gp37